MAVMNTIPAPHPKAAARIARHIPPTRLSEAERQAAGIDAMVLFECAGVVVALAEPNRDGGWPVDVLSTEENL